METRRKFGWVHSADGFICMAERIGSTKHMFYCAVFDTPDHFFSSFVSYWCLNKPKKPQRRPTGNEKSLKWRMIDIRTFKHLMSHSKLSALPITLDCHHEEYLPKVGSSIQHCFISILPDVHQMKLSL